MQDYSLFDEITNLSTEQINPETKNIDLASTQEILYLINKEDKKVPEAVESEIPYIEQAVEIIYQSIREGRAFDICRRRNKRTFLGSLNAAEMSTNFWHFA